MTKNEIIKYVNERKNCNCSSFEETMDILNERFVELSEEYDDCQIAFNELNSELGNYVLSENFLYYLSDGGEWGIECKPMPQNLIEKFNERGWDVKDENDIAGSIERKVSKTMCNVGCDAKTAFTLEMEDFPLTEEEIETYISICIPDGLPYLEYEKDIF